MEKEKFNQAKYMREWQKENMKQVKASYKTEFVDDFKEACRKLGIKQSDVFRNAMYSTIKKAEKIKMTREEIKQEIILDLEKAYEEKNEYRYYLEQLPMEGDYDNEVHSDMHDDIVNIVNPRLDAALHLVRYPVGLRHRNRAVHLDIKRNHVHVAYLPRTHPVGIVRTGHRLHGLEYPGIDRLVLDAVHQFHIRIHEYRYGRLDNEKAYHKARYRIEYRHIQREGENEPHEHPQRNDNVIAHVHRIGRQQGALHPLALPVLIERQKQLPHDGEQGNIDGYRCRHQFGFGREHALNGRYEHLHAGIEDDERKNFGSDGLRLLVSVRILLGGRFAHDACGKYHHHGDDHVGGRVDAVAQHGQAACQSTYRYLRRREHGIAYGAYPRGSYQHPVTRRIVVDSHFTKRIKKDRNFSFPAFRS